MLKALVKVIVLYPLIGQILGNILLGTALVSAGIVSSSFALSQQGEAILFVIGFATVAFIDLILR